MASSRDIPVTPGAALHARLVRLRATGTDAPPSDIAATTVRVQVRDRVGSEAVLLDCTEANGRIEFERDTGRAYLVLSGEETATLAETSSGAPVYDVRIERPGANVIIPYPAARLRLRTPVTRP